VQVRVGQAVDVVAQAGKPRAITGFQTHSTPVLLGYGERAELADDDCKKIVLFLIFLFFRYPIDTGFGRNRDFEEKGERGRKEN